MPQVAGGLFRRDARRKIQPLAMPGFNKNVLEIKLTRRRQLFDAAGNAGQRQVLENQTDATPSAF